MLFGGDHLGDLKIVGGPVGIEEATGGRRVVLVDDHQGNVAYVIRGSKAEEEEHHYGQHEGDGQGAGVANNLDEFLADEAEEAMEHGRSPRWATIWQASLLVVTPPYRVATARAAPP